MIVRNWDQLRERIRDWIDEVMPCWCWNLDPLDIVLAFSFVVLILLTGAAIYAAIAEGREWDRFAAQHHCQVVGRISGSNGVGFGVTGNGKTGIVSTYTPGKTGYQCDDGITYWR